MGSLPRVLTYVLAAVVGGLIVFFWPGDDGQQLRGKDRSKSEPGLSAGHHSSGERVGFNPSGVSLRHAGVLAGRRDPLAALDTAHEILGRRNRLIYLDAVFTTWGEEDGPAAAAWVDENVVGLDKADFLFSVADGWAESDAPAAAEWFESNTSGGNRIRILFDILEAWGRSDPDSALAWTDTLGDYARSSVIDGVAIGWAAKDPEGAARAAAEIGGEHFGDEFAMRLAEEWGETDPSAAAKWVSGIEHASSRAIAFIELGEAWAESRPDKAVAWLESIEEGRDQAYGTIGVATGWATHDPVGAMDWVTEAVTDDAVRKRVIEDVMGGWSISDPNGVANWLNARQPGQRQDEILVTFSAAIADADPESAVAWASTITDETLRDRNLNDLLELWTTIEGPEARSWVDRSGLSPALKGKFGSPTQ